MTAVRSSPGPAAAYAFRLGVIAGAIAGLAVVGVLYWQGVLSLAIAGYVLATLFPVYLVLVATVLSVWLGYDKDATALRPVHRPKNSE